MGASRGNPEGMLILVTDPSRPLPSRMVQNVFPRRIRSILGHHPRRVLQTVEQFFGASNDDSVGHRAAVRSLRRRR